MYFYELTISSTPLTQLDLTPLMRTGMVELSLTRNYNLSKIYGPSDDTESRSSVLAVSVTILKSPLTDARLARSLAYFSPQVLQTLIIRRTLFEGPHMENTILSLPSLKSRSRSMSTAGQELLPGLSTFRTGHFAKIQSSPSSSSVTIHWRSSGECFRHK